MWGFFRGREGWGRLGAGQGLSFHVHCRDVSKKKEGGSYSSLFKEEVRLTMISFKRRSNRGGGVHKK